ncbi:MAG: septation protein SepH [Actinomycetes bacterium]
MQDLRLVGVHDDGTHLLLSGAGGEMFQLPIDEALRTASRSSAKPRADRPAVPMSPRDIQARIRAGATAADVAELSGLPLAKVERYEGPVLAEREYVAQQARKVEVASPSPGHDAYRSAFGDNPATLDDMVAHRLAAHGIDPATVEWDSWRRQDGTWTVSATFEPKNGGTPGIGEEPPALWTFSPARKSLHNANRWAQQLSELEPLDGPVPARRLSAVSDRPFDFETDADAAPGNQAGHAGQQPGKDKESDGLLDMLRSRRGQRLGVDEDSDDALALLLTHGVPAAHPRPSEVVPEAEAEETEPGPEPDQGNAPAAQGDSFIRRRDARPSMLSRLSLIPAHRDPADDNLRLHDGVSTDTREITIVASPQRPSGQAETDAAEGQKTGATGGAGLDELLGGNPRRPAPRNDDASPTTGQLPETGAPERQPSRPKRSSVPSWDEIVFGTRGD